MFRANLYLTTFTLLSCITLSSAQSITPAPAPSLSPTTEATPSQSSAFFSALGDYYSFFRNSPAYSSLGLNLVFNLPGSVLSSLQANPTALIPVETTSLDLYSIATNPPLTFPTPAWQSELSPNLESDIRAAQTSAIVEVAEIAQNVLGVTQSIVVPTSSATDEGNAAPRETNAVAGAALGAAAVAFGAAAVLL